VHIHPLGEPGYINRQRACRTSPRGVGEGRAFAGGQSRSSCRVMTIVGDSDEERAKEREVVRASMSFYGSTPQLRVHLGRGGGSRAQPTGSGRKTGRPATFPGMAAQVSDAHIAAFRHPRRRGTRLADALDRQNTQARRRAWLLYNAVGDAERLRAIR